MAQGGGEGEDARVKEQDAATRGAATPLGAFKVKESIVLDRGREGFFFSYYFIITQQRSDSSYSPSAVQTAVSPLGQV